MSITRRRFLRTGMFAAAVAAIPLRTGLAQDWKDRDANPGEQGQVESDPLATYSKATFVAYLNSIFQIESGGGRVQVTLVQVDDMPSARNGEAFSLVFRGGSRQLRQNTYRVYHAALGRFELFLVPAGADRNGAQGYVATISRLSFADALSNPAPERSSSAPQRTESTQSSSPSPTDAVAPAVSAPESPATPANSTRKSGRKRKPAMKEIDQRLM